MFEGTGKGEDISLKLSQTKNKIAENQPALNWRTRISSVVIKILGYRQKTLLLYKIGGNKSIFY